MNIKINYPTNSVILGQVRLYSPKNKQIYLLGNNFRLTLTIQIIKFRHVWSNKGSKTFQVNYRVFHSDGFFVEE